LSCSYGRVCERNLDTLIVDSNREETKMQLLYNKKKIRKHNMYHGYVIIIPETGIMQRDDQRQ